MTKKEECFIIFEAHSEALRERAIELAISDTGVIKTTANTYYSAWRKVFVSKQGYVGPAKNGMQENVENITQAPMIITENKDIITKTAKEITKLAEISPTGELVAEDKGINWKADEMKSLAINEDMFKVTQLVPLVMLGKHGRYKFEKEGVRAYLLGEFISKEKMDEARQALEIWERYYGEEGGQVC